MPKLKEARRKNQRAFLRFDKLVIYDNPVNSGSTNGERVSPESIVTPINMTCYLCNESPGSSLRNHCKFQFPFHDLDDNAFKIVLYEFQHGRISYDAVGLFIDQNISYKILPEFNVSNVNIIECLFVEICIPRHKNIIIGVIYCPPSENSLEFVQKVKEIISGVTKGNKHCYISSRNGLIISDISDHLPIFSIVFGGHLPEDSNSFTFRDTSEKRVNEFRHKLENTNWDFSDQANNANDPNTAYNIFIDKYIGLFDACFPFKTIKGKALNSFRKPWLTKSLLRSINKKKLYKQYLRRRSNEKLLKYKTYKNKLTDLLRVAKRLYFQNQIELNKTNIK